MPVAGSTESRKAKEIPMYCRIGVAAIAATLGALVHAQPLPTRAGELRPIATVAVKAAPVAVPMRLDGTTQARRVGLARPETVEMRKLAELNGGGGIAAPGRPQFIGFGREIPQAMRKVELSALAWKTQGNGTRVARVEVSSPGAASVRVALRLSVIDPAATVSFAAPGAADALYSVPASTIAQATRQYGEYWSPVINGPAAAIEIALPAGTKLDQATLEIPRLSHLVVGPNASRVEEAKLLSDIGDSGSCNIDVKCVVPQDSVTSEAAAATGKLVFTVESGGTARCSGTLLSDTTGTRTPYVFSANHCFQTAFQASTLEVWWFFESESCGSLLPGNYIVQDGGAKLLGRSQDWDWALLRLNTAPPDGVSFSGWNAATVVPGSVVEIFHHPAGDLKKWSRGKSFEQQTVDFGGPAGGAGLFTPIIWDMGTTEGGSSGGALRIYDSTANILEVRGGLLGGSALCTNPTGSDYFSQFGAMLPLVREYLTPDAIDPDFVLVVEFYNPALDHYFMTGIPDEIRILDGGNPPGWRRTGFTFLAYAGPGAGRSPVCRYYQKSNNSHFYSADPFQCAIVSSMFPDWIFESGNVFYMGLPNTTTGACGLGTRPVFRFFHPSVVNHRFPAELTVAQGLTGAPGWVAEGYGPGPQFPSMCSPNGF